jgi:PAP2 superfamily
MPRFRIVALFFVCFLMTVSLPSAVLASGGEGGEDDWIRDSGDILQIALPVLGGAATFFTNPEDGKTWDKEGTKQFVTAYGLAWSSTYLIKILASKARPNGTNRTSFPSGHTMSAFAGAAFIDGRFGRTFGIPAYALAGWTGYSRVYSGWHYRDDVMAGASIGMMSNWLVVNPLPGKVQFLPTVDRYGYGVQVSIRGGDQSGDKGDEDKPRRSCQRTRGPGHHSRPVRGSG